MEDPWQRQYEARMQIGTGAHLITDAEEPLSWRRDQH
jgi:hypothetical protein